MRIFRIITSYTEDQTNKGLEKLSKETIKMLEDYVDRYEYYDLRYNDEVCHWSKGDLGLTIEICPVEHIEFIKKWDDIIHEGIDGYTTIEDITDEVLYGQHNMEIYGFFKNEMIMIFDEYIIDNITKDIVLDKINLYGVESLTENDKRILNDEPYIRYIDTFSEID